MANSKFEKGALASKKFIAYFLASVMWKIICLVMITQLDDVADHKLLVTTISGNLFAALILAGFVDVVYIGGQAAVDYYVRTVALLANTQKGIVMSKSKIEKYVEEPQFEGDEYIIERDFEHFDEDY